MDRDKLIGGLASLAAHLSTLGGGYPSDRELLNEAADALAEDDPDTIGCAEREVGRWVYNRIERLMDAEANTQESAELDYLACIASDVEEYGADGTENQASEFPPPPLSRPIEAVTGDGREGVRDASKASGQPTKPPPRPTREEVARVIDRHATDVVMNLNPDPNKSADEILTLFSGGGA